MISIDTPRENIPNAFKYDVNMYVIYTYEITREDFIDDFSSYLKYWYYNIDDKLPEDILNYCLSEGILVEKNDMLYHKIYSHLLNNKPEVRRKMIKDISINYSKDNMVFDEINYLI